MPRLRMAVQLLQSTLAACRVDHPSAERCITRSSTVPSSLSVEKISSFSGTSGRNLSGCSTARAHAFGCRSEERIENRAAWKSYAERPCCRFTVAAGSDGEDPTYETDIINQTHELSDLDTDKQCIHPGLEIEEEIMTQHEAETLEQPALPLAEILRRGEPRKEIANGQDVAETRLAEQGIEEALWPGVDIQPVPFEAEEEASVSGSVDLEKNAGRVHDVLQDGVLERNNGGLSNIDNHQGRKYLHVLSVSEVREVLEKARAKDLKVLYVKDSCEWTDYIIIAGGRSTRHLRGMADAIVYKVKQRSHNVGPNLYPLVEGREAEQWMTVDLGNITIHLFLEEARSYYNLEELWKSPPLET